MKKHIPNFITALNLISGFGAILCTLSGEIHTAAYLVILAAILDFLDGMSARILNAYSELGKQLDSLADLVSFGVAPALIFTSHILGEIGKGEDLTTITAFTFIEYITIISPVLLVVASAFRLARFNLDSQQENVFKGLPTPASGLFFASIAFTNEISWHPILLLVLPLIFAFLMTSNIPMYSLKIKNLSDPRMIVTGFLILSAIIVLFVFSVKYIFVIIILYIFISLVLPLFTNTKT